MEYPTVSALCEGVASAIRAKKGTTDLINPQDFRKEIESISGSGGGENIYEYIDVRGLEGEFKVILAMYALAVRFNGYTIPIAQFLTQTDNMEGIFSRVMAVMLDLSFVIDLGTEGEFETRDFFTTLMGIDLSSLPHLTKEQFYSLE